MANLEETGGFSINGRWATRIKYEAELDAGQVVSVELKFIIGRSAIAQTHLLRAKALEVLGYTNLAVIEEGATERKEGVRERVKGELRGSTLHYRQATLLGEEQGRENTIQPESISREVGRQHPQAERFEASTAQEVPPVSRPDNPQDSDIPQEGEPVTRRSANSLAIPNDVAQRFVRVENRFFFPDQTLAFVDRGTSLKAPTENMEVIRSLVVIAQARGWQAIRVNGTENFRRLVWREAVRQGLSVRGYTATEIERAEVAPKALNRESALSPEGSGNEVHRDSRERNHEITSKHGGRTAKQLGGRSTQTTIAVGRLIDYGPAHYQFDETKGQSYFVRLETRDGSEVKWGVDLERAFAASKTRPQVGDEIGVELLGAKPVTVKAEAFDETGRVVGQREIPSHRNSWLVEKREYFEERGRRAEALRDDRRKKDEVTRKHPELIGVVATVRLAELFAAQHISGSTDQTRFVQLVRNAIAHAIEQETPLPTPKLRGTRARSDPGADPHWDNASASFATEAAKRSPTSGPDLPSFAR
jgi:putative DNA primase/helicase